MKKKTPALTAVLSAVLSAAVLCAVMLCSPAETHASISTQRAQVPVGIIRMGGSDRFDTAALIAYKGWTGADTVFLASGYSYADALAGAPLAYAYDAPILLTAQGKLSDAARSAISQLGAKRVIILGGTSAVSSNVEDRLRRDGCDVERIYGSTRYSTAVAIAQALREKAGSSGEVFIASGANYPDALSASPAAAVKCCPILYSPQNGKMDRDTLSYIESCGFDTAYILGGKSAVGDNASTALFGAGVSARERLGGSDRYDTSLLIAKRFSSELSGNDAAFATGRNFPDALAGSVFAAKKCVPVLLTDNVSARSGAVSFLSDRGADTLYVFGSEDVVSDRVVREHMTDIKEITSSLSAEERASVAAAAALVAGSEFGGDTSAADMLSRFILRPEWARLAGLTEDVYPGTYELYDCADRPDPLGRWTSSDSYAVCDADRADALLRTVFLRQPEHSSYNSGLYYYDGSYYARDGGYNVPVLPEVSVKRVFDLGGGRVYAIYSYNGTTGYCTLKRNSAGTAHEWSFAENRSREYIDISDMPESGDIAEAVYLGVYDYNGATAVRKNMPTLKYRFRVDGEERLYTMYNGKLRTDGIYEYPIQNTLKVGYKYSLKVSGGKVTEAHEIKEPVAYTPPVRGVPGQRTLGNFLRVLIEPVGTTLYIYGGGWDWDGTASSVQSRTVGLSPDWVRFFRSQNAGFTFRDKDGDSSKKNAKTSYYPYGGINQYYYAGLDCSGYVAWAVYNTLNSQSGGKGYVMSATKMARQFSAYGYGDYTKNVPRPDGSQATAYRPGDVFSISGHIWVSLGTCADGSVVIIHSTPSYSRAGQPGGGVQIGAIGTTQGCEAYKLADRYMSRYYPGWYSRYAVSLKSPGLYMNFSGNDPGRFRWKSGMLSDPEGFSGMSAAQALARLFGE